nr:MAG TPA: 14-3-3 protein eta [Caudoviricetes sp.]
MNPYRQGSLRGFLFPPYLSLYSFVRFDLLPVDCL